MNDRHAYHRYCILDHVERSPRVTNRMMAQKLGVSVKLAHELLSGLAKRGLLHIRKRHARRWDYFLTPQGLSEKARLTRQFVEFSMQFYREARTRSSEVLADAARRGARRVAFLGATELAEIALAAAGNARRLLQQEPRVAMLSFSTNGSAEHPLVTKVIRASRLIKARCPELAIDEDVQVDAAIIPEVALRKLPDSVVRGLANVLVFPNLEAGNIGYKLAERLSGAFAIGPMLQGLAKPASDLSRGCSEDDVFYVIAVTVLGTGVRADAGATACPP